MPEWLLGAIAGGVIAFVLAQYGPAMVRRATGRLPVAVHVETDPSLIHAGDLNWDGVLIRASGGIGRLDATGNGMSGVEAIDLAPRRVRRRSHRDPCDCSRAREDAAVSIDGIRTWITERSDLSGSVLRCRVGGADGLVRGMSIDLDADGLVVDLNVEYEDERMPRSFTVAKGETERFYLVASASMAAYKWTAELILLVDGKREVVPVTDDGDPFRTSGSEGLRSLSGPAASGAHWCGESASLETWFTRVQFQVSRARLGECRQIPSLRR